MSGDLPERIATGMARPVDESVALFAARLASAQRAPGALGVLFYGSNLRTGSLEGVLDFYVLTEGPPERGIWPRVSYHEWPRHGVTLRAKVATMSLPKFAMAAAGEALDTTIWARFCQPCALVWSRDAAAGARVAHAVCSAVVTAARLAVAVGPAVAAEDLFWRALFRETYAAELRVESAGRGDSILAAHREHFDGLLPLALAAGGIDFKRQDGAIAPELDAQVRRRISVWWRKRQRLGKPYNIARLVRAAFTFKGAARYAAWKIERHTGIAVPLTPWREAHPLLAAPGVLLHVWRQKAKRA